MRTQSIPDPIEHLDFHINIDAACSAIVAEVCSGSYIPQSPTRYLAEKSKGLCRQLAIPAVRDALVLQTLFDALWDELRHKAPSKNAFFAPNEQAFAKASLTADDGYESTQTWLDFQKAILGFAAVRKYIVVTDVANYYDFISYDHLRNILAGYSITKEHSLDLLIYTLSHMLWQPDYMPRVPVGLPQMNFDAPRLLAHCFLFEIDELVTTTLKFDYARYMDDIDIGVDSISDAKRALRDLDLSMQTRQIRLNSGKTQILSSDRARRHFRVKENMLLSSLDSSMASKILDFSPIRLELKLISEAIRRGLKRNFFQAGSGSKVLKRLLTLARRYGADIDNKSFSDLLINWPALRSSALLWWQHSPFSLDKLRIIESFVTDDRIVDDYSLIEASIATVNCRMPANIAVQLALESICRSLGENNAWHLYCRMWILSKYGHDDQLFELVSRSYHIWPAHEQLSRLVAGLACRFWHSPHSAPYTGMLHKSSNKWTRSVYEFHETLRNGTAGYMSVRPIMTAQNNSLPNRISHSKFLMLLSLLNNGDIASIAERKLRSAHSFALSDPFYALL